MKWYQPFIGFVVVVLALVAFGAAIAGAADPASTHHDDDTSHVEDHDDDHDSDGEHGDDHEGDEDH